MRACPKMRLDLPLMLSSKFLCNRSPHNGRQRRAMLRLLWTQTPLGARHTFLTPRPDLQGSTETSRLNIQLEVVRSVDRPSGVSLPAMIYFHSPWSLLTSKLSLLKLKLLWDWRFSEEQFLENSQHAALIITDFIRRQRSRNVERCSTPMGYKQICYDLIDGAHDWRLHMMRFERHHIYRTIPLRVQLLRHYGHKFAFIDVVYVALRRSNDFTSPQDLDEVQHLMGMHGNSSPLTVEHPLIFAEIFVRYRRDYSTRPTPMGNVRENSRCMGQWLVSTYKILQFDLLDQHSQFDIPETLYLATQ
ncbi:uncharacterized protein LOC117581703 [Drosophila guanche]|uniref:Uncharacterized protein n=1 Tax=Drosophila guanche TaxID=7266 RepID=A0A3B0IZF1_DROGU|nr:uncharacterized protein LOC117581703 [Drosophila guanche]SPP73555.1 Hypothetical predicted protein [Drosophila guanche]